jgi:hypothetical protein
MARAKLVEVLTYPTAEKLGQKAQAMPPWKQQYEWPGLFWARVERRRRFIQRDVFASLALLKFDALPTGKEAKEAEKTRRKEIADQLRDKLDLLDCLYPSRKYGEEGPTFWEVCGEAIPAVFGPRLGSKFVQRCAGKLVCLEGVPSEAPTVHPGPPERTPDTAAAAAGGHAKPREQESPLVEPPPGGGRGSGARHRGRSVGLGVARRREGPSSFAVMKMQVWCPRHLSPTVRRLSGKEECSNDITACAPISCRR